MDTDKRIETLKKAREEILDVVKKYDVTIESTNPLWRVLLVLTEKDDDDLLTIELAPKARRDEISRDIKCDACGKILFEKRVIQGETT